MTRVPARGPPLHARVTGGCRSGRVWSIMHVACWLAARPRAGTTLRTEKSVQADVGLSFVLGFSRSPAVQGTSASLPHYFAPDFIQGAHQGDLGCGWDSRGGPPAAAKPTSRCPVICGLPVYSHDFGTDFDGCDYTLRFLSPLYIIIQSVFIDYTSGDAGRLSKTDQVLSCLQKHRGQSSR